jgi:hypothetical protein
MLLIGQSIAPCDTSTMCSGASGNTLAVSLTLTHAHTLFTRAIAHALPNIVLRHKHRSKIAFDSRVRGGSVT